MLQSNITGFLRENEQLRLFSQYTFIIQRAPTGE